MGVAGTAGPSQGKRPDILPPPVAGGTVGQTEPDGAGGGDSVGYFFGTASDRRLSICTN